MTTSSKILVNWLKNSLSFNLLTQRCTVLTSNNHSFYEAVESKITWRSQNLIRLKAVKTRKIYRLCQLLSTKWKCARVKIPLSLSLSTTRIEHRHDRLGLVKMPTWSMQTRSTLGCEPQNSVAVFSQTSATWIARLTSTQEWGRFSLTGSLSSFPVSIFSLRLCL